MENVVSEPGMDFKDILYFEKEIFNCLDYTRNLDPEIPRDDFYELMDSQNAKVISFRERLNALLDSKLYPALNDLASHQSAIPALFETAMSLFQCDMDGQHTVYLDIYLSREIFSRMRQYFIGVNDQANEIRCNYWLLRIAFFFVDPRLSNFFYDENKKHGPMFGDYDPATRDFLSRTLINVGLCYDEDTIELEEFDEFIAQTMENEKIMESWRERYGAPTDARKYSLWRWVAYYNISCHATGLLRRKSEGREALTGRIMDYVKKARDLQDAIADKGSVSLLNLTETELSFYSGRFSSEEFLRKLEELDRMVAGGAPVFDASDSEVRNAIQEVFIDHIMDDPGIPVAEKISRLKKLFASLSTLLRSGKYSYEEIVFRRYIRKYVKLADSVCAKEDIIQDIMNILEYFPSTFHHVVKVSILCKMAAEKMMANNPGKFIGICGAGSIDEVIEKKYEIISFIVYAAMAHDVGKIGMTGVIAKVHWLTGFEINEFVHKHTRYGFDMLCESRKTLPFAYIALTHHKSYDYKSGYPEDYPEEARQYAAVTHLIAIFDGLEARYNIYGSPYSGNNTILDFRKDFAEEIGRMRLRSGTQYDPDVLALFDDREFHDKIAGLLSREKIKEFSYRVFRKQMRIM